MSARSPIAVLPVLAALAGCNVAGPLALSSGRSTYNAVINRTEDEQILSIIVRQRYDETFGMLAVSSVTASIRIGASVSGNVGIGPKSGYEGNLVPFSAGAVYEENPTITYVPLRGEEFVERMLAPISAEQTLLLGRMSTDEVEAMQLLVWRANGLVNPLFTAKPPAPGFDRFIELYASLRDQGVLDVVQSGEGAFELLCHDYSAEQSGQVADLLKVLGVERAVGPRADVAIPLRFFVGSARRDGVDLETPTALEIIEVAASGVEVPGAHLADGIVRPSALDESRRFLAVHSSRTRPAEASVAVEHRGWWFYIDARDARSKQSFMILRTLIGLRLDEAAAGAQRAPILTVPVGG